MRGWLKAPLVQFFLIAAALFVLHSLVAPPQTRGPGSKIELTRDDLAQIDIAWRSKWQRQPTPAEWRGLIEQKVREEVLYREAVAMGLDQDDAIVRRRLGQKLEFLLEDVSTLRDPGTAELEAWFKRNASQFALPGRVTYCHAYFSPDRPGEQARARAELALKSLRSRPSCAASSTSGLGDVFPDQRYYADRAPEDIANVFGTDFSKALFRLQAGSWQGPIQSGLGWHLVMIEALTPGRIPTFAEVDPAEVKSAWLDSHRSESKRSSFAAMRAKYEVVLPEPPAS